MKNLALLFLGACTTSDASTTSASSNTIPLASAKLLVEHNATDDDTGFQIFADGEPWKKLTVANANGEIVFAAAPRGDLAELGITELFLETNEPPADEVPLDELLAHLPAGRYDFEAIAVEGELQTASVQLSHAIPRMPEIVEPADGATVSHTKDLMIAWKPVTHALDGAPIAITHYQVIVAPGESAPHAGFGKTKLDVVVPATATRVRVPCELLATKTAYTFEVLALAENGNQTIFEGDFSTQ